VGKWEKDEYKNDYHIWWTNSESKDKKI